MVRGIVGCYGGRVGARGVYVKFICVVFLVLFEERGFLFGYFFVFFFELEASRVVGFREIFGLVFYLLEGVGFEV